MSVIERTAFTFVVLLGTSLAVVFGVYLLWHGQGTFTRGGRRVKVRGVQARVLGLLIILGALAVALVNFFIVLPRLP